MGSVAVSGGVIYQPDPINQFYRLQYDEIRRTWVKTSAWNNVVNGHDFDAENCMAGAGAMALDAHTLGNIQVGPAGIRNRQSDMSGGIGVDDVQDAFASYGQTLIVPPDYNWSDTLYAVRTEHRFVIAGGDYDQVPDAYSCQLGGTFDHAFSLNDVRSDGQVGYFDTLCTHKKYAPQYVIRNALEKLARRVRGTDQQLFVGLTRKRPIMDPTKPRYRVSISEAGVATYDKPLGPKVGAVSAVDYICTRSDVDAGSSSETHWYRIISRADGKATGHAGEWIKGFYAGHRNPRITIKGPLP